MMVIRFTPQQLTPGEITPVPTGEEAWWAPGLVWTWKKLLILPGLGTPTRLVIIFGYKYEL
jgi:hypothetical protein